MIKGACLNVLLGRLAELREGAMQFKSVVT
jgi:hypothetical protein